MNYTDEIFVKDYFKIYDFYTKLYKNVLILIQVGSFHEIYSKDDNINLKKLSIELDIICTKKGEWHMMGFPIYVTDNFVSKLINLNYTVIKIDQTSEAPKPKREVTAIYSPSTYVEKLNPLSNYYLVSIVIDKIKNNNIVIGISAYELSTGYGTYYECNIIHTDLMLGLDNVNRYLETCYLIKEIILQANIDEEELKLIKSYLNLDEKIINKISLNNTNKLSYQKIIFEKIFINDKNIFEITNLHLYNWARWSLTNLYSYVRNLQESLLVKLKIPDEFNNKNFLYLGNHCLDQLNVHGKNKSLFDIINNTKTLLGKRFLNDTLTKPLIDDILLQERYDLIEKIIKNKYSNTLNNLLEDISDIDKLLRRMELLNIHPCEFYLLYLSFYQINKIAIFCKENSIFEICDAELNNLLFYIKSIFNLDKINTLNFNNFIDYDDNIFQINKYSDIDELYNDIKTSSNFLDLLVAKLSELIDDKKIFKKDNEEESNMVSLKFNERDGHYLYLTNRRCDILKKNFKKIVIGDHELTIDDFEFNLMPKSSYTKINCKKIKYVSDNLIVKKIKLAKLTKEKFKLEIIYILDKFNDTMIYWSKKISFIDFINSGAITSIKNHYSKPIIDKKIKSYFSGINIRHPIVEYISTDYEYKSHTLELGDDFDCGILLYGINSSGKSTLMKSIGLNIILAQIGYYVASENFKYSPYHALFTRITSNDNIYYGLSSFTVEMIELTGILKRNNSNTLVIADELCKGTETASANVIVTEMIKRLSNSFTTFITATHLHEIINLPTFKKLTNVKVKHIKLSYDEKTDKLVYDRILSDGSGPNFYGLQFAKYFIKDPEFNSSTLEILEEYNKIKKSKYHNYMIECEICKSKKDLETHHIVFQKDFIEDYHIDKLHYKKDNNYNLVTLCRICHDDVDRNKIIIYGWNESNNSRELNYEMNNNIIKNSKYNTEEIEYIKNLKLETTDYKFAQIKYKEKFNKKISKQKIELYWN